MKKILFAFALFSAGVFTTQGQTDDKFTIEKGTWNLTGSVAFGLRNDDMESSDTSRTSDYSSFLLRPSAGYAVGNNLVVGLGIAYENRDEESTYVSGGSVSESELKTNTYGIFPYVRKYFGLSQNLALSLQGEVGYSRSEIEHTSGGISNLTDVERDAFFFGIRPGLTFFLSKRFALETNLGSLGYTMTNSKNDDSESDSNRFSLNLNPSDLFFGLSYYF